jgi:hypothetical protein
MGWTDHKDAPTPSVEDELPENWGAIFKVLECARDTKPYNPTEATAVACMAFILMARQGGLSKTETQYLVDQLYPVADPVYEMMNADPK